MRQLLWSFKNHFPGDITLIRVGEEYHLFAEVGPGEMKNGVLAAATGPTYVGHAVSRDLYHWEELPIVMARGEEGSYDGFMIFHMDVWIDQGQWFMFYTGLDKRGPGQQQVVALATSPDGLHWTKHPGNPVLTADRRWYEPAIPPEATYQAKDGGRLWFRDPCIIRNDATNEYGMIVVARDQAKHPDLRGCIAWAKSRDLQHWTAHKPLFSPGKFHTVETPSIFEHAGRHYLVFFSSLTWGTPYDSGDPWQQSGMYYAVSNHGWEGPYEMPAQDQGRLSLNHGLNVRFGAARCLELADGQHVFYGWLNMVPDPNDGPVNGDRTKIIPPPRNVAFLPDGRMKITYRSDIERFTRPAGAEQCRFQSVDESRWLPSEDGVSAKHFTGRSESYTADAFEDGIITADIHFPMGHRAGLLLRSQGPGQPGLQIAIDRRLGCIELSTADTGRLIDAHRLPAGDDLHLRIVAIGPSIEIYVNDELFIHQARHREVRGRLGLFVERAQASFRNLQVRIPKD